jgi:hypothetical protein
VDVQYAVETDEQRGRRRLPLTSMKAASYHPFVSGLREPEHPNLRPEEGRSSRSPSSSSIS